MFKLGVLTEEVDDDLANTLSIMKELGLEYSEISKLWGKKVSQLNSSEVKKAKKLLDDSNIKVSCISPMIFFNVPLRAASDADCYWGNYLEHIEALHRSIDIAKELGTNIIRIFSFKTEVLLEPPLTGNHWPILIEKFQEPIEIAEKEGIILAIETCFFNNISTSALARRFLDDINSENLKVCWDMCNCLYSGEKAFPDGYNLIKNDIVHIHLKDGIVDRPHMTFNMCPLGKGDVKTYPEILNALKKDEYKGTLSFECEFIPKGGTKVEALKQSLSGFNKIIKDL